MLARPSQQSASPNHQENRSICPAQAILAWNQRRSKKDWIKSSSSQKDGELYFSCGSHDCNETFASTHKVQSDEADVFLDSRGSKGEGDVNKNALVSGWCAKLRFIVKADNISNAPSSRVFQGHSHHDH